MEHAMSRVYLPPPLVYLLAFVAGAGVDGLQLVPRLPPGPVSLLGALLVLAGTVFGFWALVEFARAGTSIFPFHAARALITTGPFRVTRNPLYLCLAVVYVGLALRWGRLGPLLMLPLAMLFLTRIIIQAEEHHLESAFGGDYRRYRAAVPRWIGRVGEPARRS